MTNSPARWVLGCRVLARRWHTLAWAAVALLGSVSAQAQHDDFDSSATKRALDKVIYEDCKDDESRGPGRLDITFVTDGRVQKVLLRDAPAPKYSTAASSCIVHRFERAKTKPFTRPSPTKTVVYTVAL